MTVRSGESQGFPQQIDIKGYFGGREGFRTPDPCRVKTSRNQKNFNKINDKIILKVEK